MSSEFVGAESSCNVDGKLRPIVPAIDTSICADENAET